ncbi:hypothetical protein GALL_264200 [mine drainage metagenome]|uniref:Rhs family protein n=1 Tax=mine drainage metagenome TaxID=410659 RepID=A0A1J5RUE7_9ZZZZ
MRVHRTVDDAGNVTAYTDGDGFTTRYGYDGPRRRRCKTQRLDNLALAAPAVQSKAQHLIDPSHGQAVL